MLFSLLLFARNCRFPRCSNSKLSLSIPSVIQNKKAPKTASKLHAQGREEAKNHQDFDAVGPAASKYRYLLLRLRCLKAMVRAPRGMGFFGMFLTGVNSDPALRFFPPPFTVVEETWQPVLPVYTSQKQAKKSPCDVVYEPWPSNMPDVVLHGAHASLHHLHVQ